MRKRILLSGVVIALIAALAAGVVVAIGTRALIDQSRQQSFQTASATVDLLTTTLADLPDDTPTRAQLALLARTLDTVSSVGSYDLVEAAAIRTTVRGSQRTIPLSDSQILIDAIVPSLSTDQPRRATSTFEVADPQDPTRLIPVDVVYFSSLTAIETPLPDIRSAAEPPILLVALGNYQPRLSLTPFIITASAVLVPALLVSILVAFIVSAWAATRIRPLSETAAQLAAGNAAARVPVTGDDELTALAESFNTMADDLEAAQQARRDFILAVGHDLRTPLTTIRGYSEALEQDAIPTSRLPAVGTALAVSSRRLSTLVEDLMLLSRIEADSFPIEPVPFAVSEHLASFVDSFTQRFADSEIALIFDPLPESTVLVLDPTRLEQVLGNLLDNALRYTPAHGTVTVALSVDPNDLWIKVVDTGTGIAREDLPHVFERLYVSQHYQSLRPTGSGIGLSIVESLTHAMGGTVLVTSRPGQGTTFTLTFPLEPSSQHLT